MSKTDGTLTMPIVCDVMDPKNNTTRLFWNTATKLPTANLASQVGLPSLPDLQHKATPLECAIGFLEACSHG